ncbi:MFS transporter [Nakamurella lactea]|uniref:MFS transporter n=1 Tax=Nakamurella lactea TaxID=459515 RepID=UPI001B7F9054|nr:MFS transporter [Nakamurella lactea]
MLAATQLIVVLDGTIVNIALPAAQGALGLSDTQRQWVVTAYALAFGALLLLGGRVADYWGRKRSFIVGMVGFGVASAIGGVAQSGAELIVARGLQGVFAALMAPAALALLTVTFPHGRERNTAFAVFGTVSGAGAAVGLVLGGLLTEYADWRWCLLVNVPFVIVGIAAAMWLLSESRAEGSNRYDWWGVGTVVLGLGSLVYGFTLAEHGWGSLDTIGFLIAGVVLLTAFVQIQRRVANPLLPLRVIAHRVRGGAFLLQAITGSIVIGATLYLTFHLQIGLGFGAFEAGLASLPMSLSIMAAAPFVTRLIPRVGPRPLLIAGPLIGAAAMLYLSRITVGGNYFGQVLPALIVLGLGLALVFVPLQNLALTGVDARDAGAASATVNAMMQIGGSIGLSVFTTLYASTVGAAKVADPASELAAFTSGYSVVFIAAAVALVLAAVIAALFVRGRKEDLLPSSPEAAPGLVS